MDNKRKLSLQDLYYIGTLVTLILIMAQVFYAKRTVSESRQWEKAKITIDNVEQFKSYIAGTPMYDYAAWAKIDELWPDFYSPEGRRMYYESIFPVFTSLIAKEGAGEADHMTDILTYVDALDTFAYPIIMGYAHELESYQTASREFYTCGTLVLPLTIYIDTAIGHHAKFLFALWRIRLEIQSIDKVISHPEEYAKFPVDRSLGYEGTEVTGASLKEYRKKMEKELKKVLKEIKTYRKQFLI